MCTYHFFISAAWSRVAASLIHEYTKEDLLPTISTVRSDKQLHFVIVLSLVVVVIVLSIVVHATTIFVHVVLHSLLVHLEPTAFKSLLEVELLAVVLILIVTSLHVLTTVVQSLRKKREESSKAT